MTDEQQDPPETEADDAPQPEPDWERRRRLAAVFGDVLPETTSDERDQDTPDAEAAADRWLRAQVPPHHG